MCNLRKITRRFRQGSLNFNLLSVVSFDTVTKWMKYHQEMNEIPDGFHQDHVFPLSKLDFENPLHLIIAHNVINVQPLQPVLNMKKHSKIPELLTKQLELANKFITDVELSEVELERFKISIIFYKWFCESYAI